MREGNGDINSGRAPFKKGVRFSVNQTGICWIGPDVDKHLLFPDNIYNGVKSSGSGKTTV